MSEKKLRSALIRLANEKPELRKELLPLLQDGLSQRRVAKRSPVAEAYKKHMQEGPLRAEERASHRQLLDLIKKWGDLNRELRRWGVGDVRNELERRVADLDSFLQTIGIPMVIVSEDEEEETPFLF